MPLVELLTGIGFVSIFALYSGDLYVFPILLVIFSLFVAIFFIDAEQLIIPDILLVILSVVVIIFHTLTQNNLLHFIASALGASLFFLLLFVVTKGKGMGFGDVKFAGVIGLLLGFPNTVIALYSSFLIGAIVSLALIVTKRKKLKGSIISFGPFMILGVLVAILTGDFILKLFF